MIYFILGFKWFFPTFLVAISDNLRPLTHQSILCILHFSPFLTKFTLLSICLIFLVSLPFLAIHISDLLSNIIREPSSGNIHGSLFNSLWINILKFAKASPEVHAALYSLSSLDWGTGPEICVPWSIGPTLWNMVYSPILLPVSEQYCQLESEKYINWFLFLILSCLKKSDKGASFIPA